MPVAGQVPEPEIIRKDENDIGFIFCKNTGKGEYK
jgi:hypothetical protein